jgi:hypothetical protein
LRLRTIIPIVKHIIKYNITKHEVLNINLSKNMKYALLKQV